MKKIVDIAVQRSKRGPVVPKKLRDTEEKSVSLESARISKMALEELRKGKSLTEILRQLPYDKATEWRLPLYEGVLTGFVEHRFKRGWLTKKQRDDFMTFIGEAMAIGREHGLSFWIDYEDESELHDVKSEAR